MLTLLAERTPASLQGRVYGAHFAWSHLWWLGAYPLAGWLGSLAARALVPGRRRVVARPARRRRAWAGARSAPRGGGGAVQIEPRVGRRCDHRRRLTSRRATTGVRAPVVIPATRSSRASPAPRACRRRRVGAAHRPVAGCVGSSGPARARSRGRPRVDIAVLDAGEAKPSRPLDRVVAASSQAPEWCPEGHSMRDTPYDPIGDRPPRAASARAGRGRR